MGYENVKLWFAKDENNSIVTIDEIEDNNKYSCPVCGSRLKPKAIKSKQVTSHFAHVDASKCNSESQIHFWFKHKFIEKGDAFTIFSDEERQFVCKDILVEEEYEVNGKVYRPDVSILTECGNTIYFEMAFSNVKKVKDYIDIWLELKNIVVEIDIKDLMNRNTAPIFKALFYDGKCFNVKKGDLYYSTIGKYKEMKYASDISEHAKERLRQLDWLWSDILKYKKGEIDINHMSIMIDNIDKEDREIMDSLFKKPSCSNIMYDYMENKLDRKYIEIGQYIKQNHKEEPDKYLFKKFEHVREPFIGSWYESKLVLEDLHKGRSIIYDFTYSDKTKSLIKDIDKVLPFNKKVEKYNSDALTLQEKLKNNCLYNEILKYLSEKDNYEFLCEVSDYQNITGNLNDFKVIIGLKYKERKIKGCNFNRKVKLDSNVDDFFNKSFTKIKDYFKELNPLKDTEKLNNLSVQLKNIYNDYNIKVLGEEFYEDVYLIRSLDDYFIFNDVICSDPSKKEVIVKINNEEDARNYIRNDLNELISSETTRKCFECGNEFTLEIGEIKFFIKKDFEFPKRCKPCRKTKKK